MTTLTKYRRIILAISLVIVNQFASSQSTGLYIADSSSVYLPAGAGAGIWGDTLRLRGRLQMGDSSSLVYFKGRVWSNDAAAVISSGKVIMNASTAQTIMGQGSYSGTGVSFERLEINNPAGVTLSSSNIRIDSQMIFAKGILFAGNHDVLLGNSAVVRQMDTTSFAAVDEGGGLSKFYSANSPFIFPIGCYGASALYNPLKLNVSAGSYNPLSYVRVTMTDTIHDKKTPRHMNYGEKFWSVQFRNFTIDSAAYTAKYNAGDQFGGDTSKIIGTVWAGGKWLFNSSGRIPGAALAITGKITSDADIFGQDKVLQVQAKAILEGAWNGSAMNVTLRTNNIVPLNQPYGAAPYDVATFNYAGSESRTSLPSNAVDWVLVELRYAPKGLTVARSVGLLLNNGTIVDGYTDGPLEFPGVSDGNYYIVVKHRNHLPIMSAAPVSFPNSTVYDFTTAMAQGYGSGKQMAALSGGKFGLHAGNVINDNVVRALGLPTVNDLSKIVSGLGGPSVVFTFSYHPGDVNMDGTLRALGLPSGNDFMKLQAYLGSPSISNTITF